MSYTAVQGYNPILLRHIDGLWLPLNRSKKFVIIEPIVQMSLQNCQYDSLIFVQSIWKEMFIWKYILDSVLSLELCLYVAATAEINYMSELHVWLSERL